MTSSKGDPTHPRGLLRPTLVLILGLALLCRLALALFRTDLVWPDEQFQTLEPASRLVFGYGFKSWEWIKGFRTWLLPLFFTPPLAFGKLLGTTSGLPIFQLTRIYAALLDTLMLGCLAVWMAAFRFAPVTRWGVLALAAFLPSLQLWGVTTLQDHLAEILLSFSFTLIVHSKWQESKKGKFLLGLSLGIPGWVKIQLGVFSVGFVIAWIARECRQQKSLKAGLKAGLPFILGGMSSLLILGWVDLATLGHFAGSVLNQITQGESISRFYGTGPWYQWFEKLGELTGLTFWALFLGAAFLRALLRPQSTQRSHEALLPMVFGMGLFLLFHALIPHKETRFLLPMVPFFLVIFGALLDPWGTHLEQALSISPRFQGSVRRKGPQVLISLGIGLFAGFGFLIALQRPLYLTSVNTADLEDRISLIRPRLTDPQKVCVVLAGHNFSWTHGALILGAEVDYLDIGLNEVSSKPIPVHCQVALVRNNKATRFEQYHPQFVAAQKGAQDFSLYVHQSLVKSE